MAIGGAFSSRKIFVEGLPLLPQCRLAGDYYPPLCRQILRLKSAHVRCRSNASSKRTIHQDVGSPRTERGRRVISSSSIAGGGGSSNCACSPSSASASISTDRTPGCGKKQGGRVRARHA